MFTGSTAPNDLNNFQSAVMYYSYGTPSYDCTSGAGTNTAAWTQVSIDKHPADSVSSQYWVTIKFAPTRPGGAMQGTGKGIIIITQNVSGTLTSYQVGTNYMLLDDPF
jgi:hypothetical protein